MIQYPPHKHYIRYTAHATESPRCLPPFKGSVPLSKLHQPMSCNPEQADPDSLDSRSSSPVRRGADSLQRRSPQSSGVSLQGAGRHTPCCCMFATCRSRSAAGFRSPCPCRRTLSRGRSGLFLDPRIERGRERYLGSSTTLGEFHTVDVVCSCHSDRRLYQDVL